MPKPIPRREAVKQLTLAGAGLACSGGIIRGQTTPIVVNGKPVEIVVASVSPQTVRLTVMPIDVAGVLEDGALVAGAAGRPSATKREAFRTVRAGDLRIRVTDGPPVIHIEDASGKLVQRLTLDARERTLRFLLPRGRLSGSAGGGRRSDRRGPTTG